MIADTLDKMFDSIKIILTAIMKVYELWKPEIEARKVQKKEVEEETDGYEDVYPPNSVGAPAFPEPGTAGQDVI